MSDTTTPAGDDTRAAVRCILPGQPHSFDVDWCCRRCAYKVPSVTR